MRAAVETVSTGCRAGGRRLKRRRPPVFGNVLEHDGEALNPTGDGGSRTTSRNSITCGYPCGAASEIEAEKCNAVYMNQILAARNRIELSLGQFDRQFHWLQKRWYPI